MQINGNIIKIIIVVLVFISLYLAYKSYGLINQVNKLNSDINILKHKQICNKKNISLSNIDNIQFLKEKTEVTDITKVNSKNQNIKIDNVEFKNDFDNNSEISDSETTDSEITDSEISDSDNDSIISDNRIKTKLLNTENTRDDSELINFNAKEIDAFNNIIPMDPDNISLNHLLNKVYKEIDIQNESIIRNMNDSNIIINKNMVTPKAIISEIMNSELNVNLIQDNIMNGLINTSIFSEMPIRNNQTLVGTALFGSSNTLGAKLPIGTILVNENSNNIFVNKESINDVEIREINSESSKLTFSMNEDVLNKQVKISSDTENSLNNKLSANNKSDDKSSDNKLNLSINSDTSESDNKDINENVSKISLKTKKIDEIKNLAKSLNIKITENGKPKTKENLIKEIINKNNLYI